MKTAALVLFAGLLALTVPAAVTADSVEEDLALVKNATTSQESSRAPAEASPRSTTAKDGPRWFRVRIVEKGDKKATVKVNLPLFLVQAVGEDMPIPGCEGRRGTLTLGEVLQALDSGENLVEIEDEDATVRVWVD